MSYVVFNHDQTSLMQLTYTKFYLSCSTRFCILHLVSAPPPSPVGAVLRSLYKAERGEVADAVQRCASSPPGDVSRSAGECESEASRVRLPYGIHTLPEEVDYRS